MGLKDKISPTTKDAEIRAALHHKKLSCYISNPDVLIVDELGLSHAKARIDIAVINGCIHGYEIKSSLDTLDRLPQQLEMYTKCLEKLTVVAAPRHVERIVKITPNWCGVVQAEKGSKGAITFSTLRRSSNNREVDTVQLAHLLWKSEAIALLSQFDSDQKLKDKSRKFLYEALVEYMSISQLTDAIKSFMRGRREWKYRTEPA